MGTVTKLRRQEQEKAVASRKRRSRKAKPVEAEQSDVERWRPAITEIEKIVRRQAVNFGDYIPQLASAIRAARTIAASTRGFDGTKIAELAVHTFAAYMEHAHTEEKLAKAMRDEIAGKIPSPPIAKLRARRTSSRPLWGSHMDLLAASIESAEKLADFVFTAEALAVCAIDIYEASWADWFERNAGADGGGAAS
jgi:hypothetical protein